MLQFGLGTVYRIEKVLIFHLLALIFPDIGFSQVQKLNDIFGLLEYFKKLSFLDIVQNFTNILQNV